MIDEQNNRDENLESNGDTGRELEKNEETQKDDYYSVDDPKKDVNTSIGDGEMHNEGLVGDGSVPEDDTFSEGITTKMDEAENHDSEG